MWLLISTGEGGRALKHVARVPDVHGAINLQKAVSDCFLRKAEVTLCFPTTAS